MLGTAVAHFHVSPSEFWSMTMREFYSAFFSLFPPEENNNNKFVPFSDEEEAIFERMKKSGNNSR